MQSPTSQSSPEFHSSFNKEKTSAETETRLDFISSIWDDDHIWRLDEKNWQCLWCNQCFQGINDTKALAHVLGKLIWFKKRLQMNVASFFYCSHLDEPDNQQFPI